MKKLLTLCAAALMSLSTFAATGLNVYATGMKSVQTDNNLAIEYTLNTKATQLYVVFFDASGEQYDAVIVTDSTLLTEGAHTTTIALPEDMEAGTYTWGINAFGAATTFADIKDNSAEHFNYYLPQDVVVDNSPESPYFGQIYVCVPWVDSDGMTNTTKTQLPGVYVYNPQLDLANYLQGYQGGITIGGKDRQTIKRMTVGPDGMVYIGGNNTASNPGVWKMDPATPNAWTAVLDPATAATDYVKVAALEVVGNKLYTLNNISTETGTFNTYDLTATPYATRTATDMTMDKTMGNADCTIRHDGRGGFWVTQNRYAVDAYSALMHWSMSAKGKATIDFAINSSADDAVKDLLNNELNKHNVSYRGTLGVSPDGQFIAMGSDKTVRVFQVTYDETTGIPSLTEYCRTGTIGGNIDGVAFDYANNLYFASASVEEMYVYPIAKEDNHCLAPAPKQYTITIESAEVEALYLIGDNQGWDLSKPVAMTKTAANVFECTETFTKAANWFAFTSVNSTVWDEVNANRYGGATADELVTDGSVATLAKANACLTCAAGTYTFTVDLNAMTCTVAAAAGLDEVITINVEKVIEDGQVYIIKNGTKYTVLGAEVK